MLVWCLLVQLRIICLRSYIIIIVKVVFSKAISLTLFFLLFQTTSQSLSGIGHGINREIFFLNLEDGYFGCQVNESTDVLQLFELSKLCDGVPNCFLGSDELRNELKCSGKFLYSYESEIESKILTYNSLTFLLLWKAIVSS